MLNILGQVDELRDKEAQLVEEKESHREQAKKSEEEYLRCEGEIKELKANEQQLKAEMIALQQSLFFREDENEVIAADDAHVPYDGSGQINTGPKRAWNERAAQLKKVQ
jgi:predicted nuclease with TOPRIM domain